MSIEVMMYSPWKRLMIFLNVFPTRRSQFPNPDFLSVLPLPERGKNNKKKAKLKSFLQNAGKAAV